jgi:hypothetical protein
VLSAGCERCQCAHCQVEAISELSVTVDATVRRQQSLLIVSGVEEQGQDTLESHPSLRFVFRRSVSLPPSAMVARKQEFTCDQTLLRASNRERREPFEIAKSSHEDLAADIIPILTKRMSKLEPKVNIGARTALRILAAQGPDKPDYEQGGRTKTRDLMPGGLPVIDHMVATLDHPIGWGALRTVLERFQKTRCPTVNRLDTHAVLEVVLGKSSEEQYIQAADWVDTKQWAGAEQYGCMMVVCYTESLEVIREAHISNWQGFLDGLEIANECVYLYKNPGVKPRVQMPVLFMYGSYNLQLVCLDMTYVMKNGKSAFQISKGEVPREFGQLMSKCHSAVGQDVTKDMEEFF